MKKCKMTVVRFDGEDVIATSGILPTPTPVPSFFDLLPEGAPMTYQGFQQLTNLQKIQLQNEIGEEEYNAYVFWLQNEYKEGGIAFGD